ncbi:MAG TPA: TonB-dependent receptor, partial [Myxococcota bacterium]|nr:TonB-dependent receptor [Myxococcota bacterium]
NPTNAFSDANALFLSAAKYLDSSAQSLFISLPEIHQPFSRGIVGFGSQNTFKVAAGSGVPIDKNSSIFSATQMSSTDGDFAFEKEGEKQSRLNNDQHRILAIASYEHRTDQGSANILAAVNAHEGGVPGFLFAPIAHLRSRALFSGLTTSFAKKINTSELNITLAHSLFDYETNDQPPVSERFIASTHELSWGLNSLKLPKWLDLKLWQNFVIERAYSVDQTRLGGGFFMRRDMHFNVRLKPKVFAAFGIMGYEQQGLIFKKDLGVSIEPWEKMLFTARAARSQRLPTLLEMYVNNRFLAGNADLKKESIWDIELGSDLTFFDHTQVKFTGYFGYLSDTIAYVPFMATRLRPTNTGSATRFGLDMAVNYRPVSWLMFESKNTRLRSKLKDTNAPIPNSPPFLGVTGIRLGPKDIATLSLNSRYKGPSFADLNGSLRANPYIIFDALATVPVGRFIALSLSVLNILNVRTAKDSYGMPLPGTTIFGQIELGNESLF